MCRHHICRNLLLRRHCTGTGCGRPQLDLFRLLALPRLHGRVIAATHRHAVQHARHAQHEHERGAALVVPPPLGFDRLPQRRSFSSSTPVSRPRGWVLGGTQSSTLVSRTVGLPHTKVTTVWRTGHSSRRKTGHTGGAPRAVLAGGPARLARGENTGGSTLFAEQQIPNRIFPGSSAAKREGEGRGESGAVQPQDFRAQCRLTIRRRAGARLVCSCAVRVVLMPSTFAVLCGVVRQLCIPR